jgi:DNA polymerase I-like protein with 3'-5' exonuclease and polymerase domains
MDIEGVVDNMTCISLAVSPSSAFIIPFTGEYGQSYWSDVDELAIWEELSALLADPDVPKVLQNSLYDRFVLQYSYNMVINNVVEDTMLKAWEKCCEWEKGLGFLCSIYTREPYYKSDRKSSDLETHWRYCCKDSAVTYEIAQTLEPMLEPDQKQHYKFNIELLNPLLYMELRGIKYDSTLAAKRNQEVEAAIYGLQAELDALAGVGIKADETADSILNRVRTALCHKKHPDRPKKAHVEDYAKIVELLKQPLTAASRASISVACDWSVNIKSPQFKEFIYEKLNLEKQYKEDSNGKKHLSSDYESLLKVQKKTPHQAIVLALQLGGLRTRHQMLAISADQDGRIRCAYNAVGTETGRLTCYTSPTGSGYNLQTIPSDSPTEPDGSPLKKGMRDLFVADAERYLFQCDLSGADGWTVAAHLAALGDRTMLDDYCAGIKPAKVLCYLLRHGADSLRNRNRDEIKQLTKEVSSKDWDYFLCKIGQHGTSYLMGPQALANNVFKQSEGKMTITRKEAEDLQKLFNVRYRVRLWHTHTQNKLSKKPVIVAASGHHRRFFGRHEQILGQALAHEPQANTTYATNLAATKLWNDKENYKDGALRIEPLHQVHDALLGQFKIEDTEWAVKKIKSYFDNPMNIAGVEINIPFEGAYGISWGNLDKGII